MIEKGKISAFQMALLISPTIIATAILTVAAITSQYAGRDMWMSPIWGSLNGFLTVFIVTQLHKQYPQESIIQYSEHIIGRIPGKIVGFFYLIFLIQSTGTINLQYAVFIISSFLPKTPQIVIMGIIVLVCAFAVRGGVEVLGRAAQLFTPIFLFSPLFLILLFPELKLRNMFPIMEHGLLPSILGSTVPLAWFAEVFLITMLLPSLTDQTKGRKWGMISVLVTMLFLVFENIVSIMLFGESITSYSYPIFSAFRYISVSTFFEHLEALIIVIWVMGAFIKLSVFYYAIVLGTAQWLKLSDYRPIVFPIGFIIVLFSIWVFPTVADMAYFIGKYEPFYLPSFLTALPALLLLISIIQKKGKLKISTFNK